jgi:hypothetical protein
MAVRSELVDENVRVTGEPMSEIHLVRNNQEATAECLSWHGTVVKKSIRHAEIQIFKNFTQAKCA